MSNTQFSNVPMGVLRLNIERLRDYINDITKSNIFDVVLEAKRKETITGVKVMFQDIIIQEIDFLKNILRDIHTIMISMKIPIGYYEFLSLPNSVSIYSIFEIQNSIKFSLYTLNRCIGKMHKNFIDSVLLSLTIPTLSEINITAKILLNVDAFIDKAFDKESDWIVAEYIADKEFTVELVKNLNDEILNLGKRKNKDCLRQLLMKYFG